MVHFRKTSTFMYKNHIRKRNKKKLLHEKYGKY